MGFDILYLPPIHPIGMAFRKGPNNNVIAGPDDEGSPWAIGSPGGGPKAIHSRVGPLAHSDLIGMAFRKGPNNNVIAGPDDEGSPWAIGSPEGGHKAIHSRLGTFADFDHLVNAARDLGMEIALDRT